MTRWRTGFSRCDGLGSIHIRFRPFCGEFHEVKTPGAITGNLSKVGITIGITAKPRAAQVHAALVFPAAIRLFG